MFIYFANGIRQNLANLEISQWSLSELLINYEGGFVRRGIFGQIVFSTSNPIYFATLLQKIALGAVFFGFLLFLYFEKSNLNRILFSFGLTFAPGGLQDMRIGNTYQGGLFEYLDRKEIWFYLGIILIFISIKFFFRFPITNSIFISAVCILLILHHELFIIFALTLYTSILLATKFAIKSSFFLGALLFYGLVLSTFLLVYVNHGNETIANAILASYQEKFPGLPINGGGIHAIAWSISQSHELPLRLINEGSILYYFFFAILSIIFIFIYSFIKFRKKSQLIIATVLNLGNLIGCIAITYVFWDVGRLISIYTIATLLSLNVLSLVFSKLETSDHERFANSENISDSTRTKLILGVFLIYFVFITSITRVEHCCPQPAEIPLKSLFNWIN